MTSQKTTKERLPMGQTKEKTEKSVLANEEITSEDLNTLKAQFEADLQARNEIDARIAAIQDKLRTYFKEARKLNETVAEITSGTSLKDSYSSVSETISEIVDNTFTLDLSGVKKFFVNWVIPIVIGLLILVAAISMGRSTSTDESTTTCNITPITVCMTDANNNEVIQ